MNMRYIRIDIEYEPSKTPFPRESFAITDNIRRIIKEDMPYCKIVFTRDSPNEEELNRPRYKHS